MKRPMIALVSVVLLVFAGLVYSQTQTPKQVPVGGPIPQGATVGKPNTTYSRYQLVPATATYEGKDGRQAEGPEVFLLDTENGRVWIYEFSRPSLARKSDGTLGPVWPASFSEVPVGSDATFEKMQQNIKLWELKNNRKQP